jgi:hypothetical protein
MLEQGLPDKKGHYNKLALEGLKMQVPFLEMGAKFSEALTGKPFGSSYMSELIPEIRKTCGGTTYEMREAAADGDRRFKRFWQRYQELKKEHLQKQQSQNTLATNTKHAKFIPNTPPSQSTSKNTIPNNLRKVMNGTLFPLLDIWNQAHNLKNINILKSLYGSNIKYYGKKLTRKQCLKDKQRLFKKLPSFTQSIRRGEVVKMEDSTYKILFNKVVKSSPSSEAKIYPSYLVIDTSENSGRIIEESDYVTDWNIKKRRLSSLDKMIPTLNCSREQTLRGNVQIVYSFDSPGFGENPETDSIVGNYILHLDKPIIVPDNGNECDYGETIKAYEVQLMIDDPQMVSYIKARASSNKPIAVSGKFFTANTMHHKRKLLLEVFSVN